MKLIKGCIAMTAFAAILAMPSIASAVELYETPSTTPLPVGTKIMATNVAHAGTASTITKKSNLGNVECTSGTLTGTLTKNSEGIIEWEVDTAEFRGKHSAPGSLHCVGGFGGDITTTPSHTSPLGLPWCVRFTQEDKVEVRGGKCGAAAVSLKWVSHTATLGTCTWERTVATGPMVGTYTTHPADAIMTFQSQKFTKTAGSVFCPSSLELFMAFTLTTDINGVSGPALQIK
jgi:hypothetical protein